MFYLKMLMLVSLILFVNVKNSVAVIYSINETEYSRMPPLYALDEYRACVQRPAALYCLLDADLFSTQPSDLLNFIHEYSEYSLKHFNHTQIHRGVCVTETCGHIHNGTESCGHIHNGTESCGQIHNGTEDLEHILEACLNESIWREYQLQVKLKEIRYCDREGDWRAIDTAEMVVAVVYFALIILNVAGSWYDFWLKRKRNCNEGQGNPWLLAFSLKRNWVKLTSVSEGGDPRKRRLKAIHGMRTMTLACVLFSHTVLIMAYSYIDNPLYIEKSYEDPLKQILYNGSLVTQTFFLMSSFLLAYNYQLYAETHAFSWWLLPKGILNRWLRLTPTYALILATISTWMSRLGGGPLWRLVVRSEGDACRRYWWSHLLYINNYVYENAHCMPQTWYLAADTQLFCVGLALGTAAWRLGARGRRWLLGGAMLAGVLAPALHTYLQDLDAVVLQSPETYRNLYERDDTFRLVYVRGHNNVGGYALGLIAGYIFYSLQTDGGDLNRFKRYRWLYWTLFPLGFCFILTGGVFYTDGARAPLAARALYAALYKIVFTLMVACMMVGAFLKVESVYRGAVEWGGWRVCGRVSYCAFLAHTLLQRGLVGAAPQPTNMSDYYVLMILFATVFMSFLVAVPLCLLVEMPLSHLQRLLLEGRRRPAPAAPPVLNITLIKPDGHLLQSKL